MRYRIPIAVLTLLLTLISAFTLSVTWVNYKINQEALRYATDAKGAVDYKKKQDFLLKKQKKEVFRIPGIRAFTLAEIQNLSVSFGADLEGGKFWKVELDKAELLKEMAGHFRNSRNFLQLLANAKSAKKEQPKVSFFDLFYKLFKEENEKKPLNSLLVSEELIEDIGGKATDKKILHYLKTTLLEKRAKEAVKIYNKRFDTLGTSSVKIYLDKQLNINIEMPLASQEERVKELIATSGDLNFYLVADKKQEMQSFLQELQKFYGKKKIERLLVKTAQGEIIGCHPAKKKKFLALLGKERVQLMIPMGYTIFLNRNVEVYENKQYYRIYLAYQNWNGKGVLSGDTIKKATHEYRESKYVVEITMNSKGAKSWQQVTRKNIGHPVAIVVGKEVYCAPTINTEIPSGVCSIEGGFNEEDVKDLANVISSGKSPKVKFIESAVISADLSAKQQREGKLSILLGFLLIILFMLAYYASSGALANLGLFFNMLFILGVLGQISAALTLTGIAGIVLTIGMAIDANVLIFERIREELRQQLSVKLAIEKGYEKALASILDSNCTTLLIGVVLYLFSEGAIKGFATTLIIGIFSSVFTAVFVTRLFLTLFDYFFGLDAMKFSYRFTENLLTGANFNFLKFARRAYLFSFFFILLGGALLYQQGGLNLSSDFLGGRTYIMKLGRPVAPEEVKEALQKTFENKSVEIKNYGGNDTLKITTTYLMEVEDADTDVKIQESLGKSVALATGLRYEAKAGSKIKKDNFIITSSSKVGPVAADQVKEAAQTSLLLCLLLIFLYILIRFRKWQFSLAAVLALFHDVLCVFSAFALARQLGYSFDIDQVFVASILTIIGYSINDTVVVFDRVRELSQLFPRTSFRKVVNQAINETISRTLITSFTTLLAVLSLLIFGGEALRGFAFSLLVGIVFGTYSSVCIATPLATETIREKK